jgi:hypothetical protein
MITLRDSAEAALRLLESWALTIDGEWGDARSLEELEADGALPVEILHLRFAIEQHDEMIADLIEYMNSEGKNDQ